VATRAVVDDVPPLSLAVLRYGLGGLILALFLALWAPAMLRVRRKDLHFITLLAALLFGIFPFAFNAGLRWTEASQGALVLATIPVWTALLARSMGRELLSPRQGLGLVLTIIGVVIAVTGRGIDWDNGALALAGDGLMLIAAVCGSIYSVLVKRAFVHYSALTVTAYGMLFGTVMLAPAALVEGLASVRVQGQTLALVLFLGVIGGALLWWLFAYALGRMGPTQAAVYINLNPLTAMILAVVLLHEPLLASVIVGMVVVLTGVLLVNWPKRVAPVATGPADVVVPS
jgi:drug/metabolite transporter (DMT)-like permease